jgi:hypothetical protein
MAITADDLQAMATHWLGTRPNGYLGSGYGSSVQDLLQTPLSAGGADALIAKLRSDIAIMGQLPADTLGIYAEPYGPDKLTVHLDVAGRFIRLDGATAPANP